MAGQRTGIVCLVATAAMLIQLTMAANYMVGSPNGGWDLATDIQSWATSQTFSVGDNLVFQYTPTHNVVEVSKADYDSCQMSNIIQSYSDGNTAIPLDTPGKRYFICGTPGHCSQGMKLEIDTLATASPPQASPANPPVASPVPDVPSPLPAQSPDSAPAMSPVYPAESPMNDILPSPDVPSGLPLPDVPSGSPLSDVPSGSPFPDVPLAESPGSLSPGDSLPQTPDTAAAKAGFETNLKIGFVLGMVMLLAL